MRSRLSALALCLAATSLLAQNAPAPQRHRIAILDFGDGAVMGSSEAIFGTRVNVGKGISDLLMDKLVNGGTYRIVERNAIAKIMGEQNFSNSGAVDSGQAAKIGKILGVDAIVVGDITTFGRDDSHKGASGGGGSWAGYGLGHLGVNKSKAIVAITARLIDVNTAEVLASASSRGESSRSGASFGGAGGSWWRGGGGDVDFGSSNFGETIIGEATQSAVDDLSKKLEADADKLPTAEAVPISGMVADVSGNQIITNVGKDAGVQVGQKLSVMHPVRQVKDPATGKVLRSIENNVGEITITSVDASSSVGTFAGSGSASVGDSVKSH